MSNIEEDIKILEDWLKVLDDFFEKTRINNTKERNALRNALAERKQDKARIQELEAKLEFKQWGDLDNIQFEEYINQFVSKQKVKDKIEEYDRKMTEDKGHPNWVVTDRIVMNVLEELLEDK